MSTRPRLARSFEISDADIRRALVEAPSIRPDRYTILSKVKLDTKTAGELAKMTGVT